MLHNRYQQRGGEDAVVEQEYALIKKSGLDVHLIEVSNDQIKTSFDKARALWRTPNDPSRADWIDRIIREVQPNILHVHNFFPLLTPAVHVAAERVGVAVVQTLHNYRLICASAMLLRDGNICEDCLTHGRKNAVIHRCYRGSFAGSVALAALQERADRKGTWQKSVHRFIALTEFAKSKFIQGGLPAKRLVVKPNFLEEVSSVPSANERSGALFVGRISAEKGLRTLLEAWSAENDERLTIVGEGPELSSLKRAYSDRATFVGHQSADSVKLLMAQAAVLIVPSIWYEGFPMTIVEAFAAGLPVIASDIGSLSSIVRDGENGLKFQAGSADALRLQLRTFFGNPSLRRTLSAGAKGSFDAHYTDTINLALIKDIYNKALQEVAVPSAGLS